jgi:uncharacterized protein (TIGR04168 family)
MGGSEFSFGRQLEKRYGVTGLEHSSGRLKRLVDESPTEAILFLAHNGPFGLGGDSGSPWARDFRLPEELEEDAPRDWGDKDLTEAIEYARASGKEVLGVIAGHMHRSPRARQRAVVTQKDGSSFINAAVVPRILPNNLGERHHFIDLSIQLGAEAGSRVRATEMWQELLASPVAVVSSSIALTN